MAVSGIASKLPVINTYAFIIGFVFSYLSQIMPPRRADEKPKTVSAIALQRANVLL